MAGKISDRIVEATPWLDGVAEKMKAAYAPFAGEQAPRPLKDALVGTWLGHPLHPALVTLPIGFWTSTLALDLAGEEKAADLMLGLGLLSSVSAVATGAAQWMDATKNDKPRRLGALHAMLNGVATGLYGASFVCRKTGARGAGFALSTAGYGVLQAGGWLGGDLAYDLGLGVDHTAFDKPPADWTDALAFDDLQDGTPKRVELDGAAVMLLKRGDEILAAGAVCPHLGGPLDEGEIDGDDVTCPWHGSVFCLRDGALLHGPATAPIASYDVRVQNGRVEVKVKE